MRWCIIKWMLLVLFLVMVLPVKAQRPLSERDGSERWERRMAREEHRRERFERRLKNYQTFWQKLIPQYQKIQFAGSIGLISLGMGWDYGKHNQWETDMLFGFIPRFSSDEAKLTFTLKQNYIPWEVRLSDRWRLEPLSTGIFLNTVLDNDFWVKEPDKYPNHYYKFSTRLRFHAFLGQRLSLGVKRASPFKKITFFYELSSCDLYIITAVTNKCVGLDDILSFSFGMKLNIL